MKRLTAALALLFFACATTGGPPVDKKKMAEGYYMKGLSFVQEKKYELASVEFHRSIQTDSDHKESYYMLGIISDYRGQYEAAVAFYQEAIDRDPDYSEAYNAMGAAYSRLQKPKEAIKVYKRAVENKLYPTPHIPYLNMGRLYLGQKDYDKAVEAFREAKRYARQDFVIYELGNALLQAGRVKDSISEFREGIVLAPQNADFRFSLAVALLKSGSRKDALAEFKKAAQLAPPGSEIALQSNDYIKTLR